MKLSHLIIAGLILLADLALYALPLQQNETTVTFGTAALQTVFNRQDGRLLALRANGRTLLEAPPQDNSRLWLSLRQEDNRWLTPQDGAWSVENAWEQPAPDTICATLRLSDWRVRLYTRILSDKAQLCRWAEIAWQGQSETKLRGFSLNWGAVTLTDDLVCLNPAASISPRRYTAADLRANNHAYTGFGPREIIIQNAPDSTLLFLNNELAEGYERGSRVVKPVAGIPSVIDEANIQSRMKPGVWQRLGDAWLWHQPNDAETALLRTHEWYRDRGAVPPADRPDWVQRATLYSFHPGGTIGSGWSDWGGFAKATPQIARMAALGCNTLWILPVESDGPYHPRDYYAFAAGLGTAEQYRTLVQTAKKLNLHVWQDIVPHGGTDTCPRAVAHPEWLLRDEKGGTLSYWCFDFRNPDWCNYMKGVAAHYVTQYGIDGYRIDACGGSKIPNWNPDIPYARASTALVPGGLAMQKAIRQGVREHAPDGANLAESGDNYSGTVSDCIYDFTLCYNMMQQLRSLPAADFVRNIRRWLHEQRCASVPGQIFMRHIESHDSLRAEYWYGPGGVRAAMAISAWCYGIPMVYQDMEDGHAPVYRHIFALRNSCPEIGDGDQDTLSVQAPDGVFAVLRASHGNASIGLVNCNATPLRGITVSIPADKLPPARRDARSCANLWNGTSCPVAHQGDKRVVTLDLDSFGCAFLRFADQQPAIPQPTTLFADQRPQLPCQTTRLDRQGNPTDGTPEGGLLIRLPLDANETCEWRADAAAGTWQDTFRTRYPGYDGRRRLIYYLPQGSNVLWDSRLWPFGVTAEQARLSFATPRGTLTLQFSPQNLPPAVMLLDRVGDCHDPHVYIANQLPDLHACPEAITPQVTFTPYRTTAPRDGHVTPNLTAEAGKWIFDNGRLRLAISRAGTILNYQTYQPDGSLSPVFAGADIYTDAGYTNPAKFQRDAAGSNVEPFSRIEQLPDGSLRLRFSGKLRGFNRFDLIEKGIEYYYEYRLGKGDGFQLVFGVRPNLSSFGERVFLAFNPKMAESFQQVDLLAGQKLLLSGQRSDQRDAQTSQNKLSQPVDTVRLLNRDKTLLCRLNRLTTRGIPPENIFIHGRTFYIAFCDHHGTTTDFGQWRLVGTTITTNDSDSAAPALPELADLPDAQNAFQRSLGFELPNHQEWLARIVQNIPHNAVWTMPRGSALVSDTVHSGKYAFRVDGATGEYRLAGQDLDLNQFKPGTRWRITAWCKAQNVAPEPTSWMTGTFRFHATTPKGNKFLAKVLPMGTYDWTQFTYDCTLPENLTKLTFSLGLNGNTGTLWIDDVTFEPIKE